MPAAELPGTDEERAAQALIAAAGKLLAARHRDAPEGFVAALLSRPVPGRSSRTASPARRKCGSNRPP
jgi:hypothetical protein